MLQPTALYMLPDCVRQRRIVAVVIDQQHLSEQVGRRAAQHRLQRAQQHRLVLVEEADDHADVW